MKDTGQENETGKRTYAEWLARLSAIVTILPAAMAAGWLLGYFVLDRLLHSYPWCSMIGTLLGAGAGFYEIVRILMPRKDRQGPSNGRY